MKRKNMASRFDNWIFLLLLADFNGNRVGKQSNTAGKVLNAAYTNRNFYYCYEVL